MIDESKTIAAVKTIANRQKALGWLLEHGVKFTGRSEDREAVFSVDVSRAGSCHGADEACSLIEAYARAHLPDIIASAISACRNDIDIARDTIAGEIAKDA